MIDSFLFDNYRHCLDNEIKTDMQESGQRFRYRSINKA